MSESFHATTIVSVRRGSQVVIGGDGQVTLGNTVVKSNARKVRRLAGGRVLAGFAGATADAFTLFELFEQKLEKHGQLVRAAVELAKDWRTERRFGKPGLFEVVRAQPLTGRDFLKRLAANGPHHVAAAYIDHRAIPGPAQRVWL